ncbi:MAG: NADH-quinone oxidoreductase subunit E [Anaerolineae bacterium]|nr:MAG: NADH-quinone oxidoreductase subunit E [Anaerolineae bacterium]
MSEIDLLVVRQAIEPYVGLGRSGLLPALHAAQRVCGWISSEVAVEVGRTLGVPLADVHGVIEFYSLFYNHPVGRRIVRVCTDVACMLKGGDGLLAQRCAEHGLQPGETTPDGALTVEAAPCLGMCDLAPAVLTTENGRWRVGEGALRPQAPVYGVSRLLTARCGRGRQTTLAEYGGYEALRKALKMSPQEVIAEIKAAGLVGRGGAAFPTGVKWEAAAKAQGSPKYVVCNTDESEPGTFKDRVLLMDDPHSILEGMLIAGYAIGAARGYFYVRGEYAYMLPVLEAVMASARQAGLLGENILNSGFSFDVEIRLGAGAYICGEETALFESIEGKRGFPRIKPPFPTTHGLFGKPTVINNVETMCNVPLILRMGAQAYRNIGTEKSTGPKLFCVSGDVVRPGVYEVPFGVTLRELLDIANGSPVERLDGYSVETGQPDNWITNIQAILFGGAAGTFATAEHLDVRLTFEDLRAAGLSLGSGVVMVFDRSRDLRQVLLQLGHFFAHESCGKCYPCQMGTQRQVEILERLAAGKSLPGDFERLQDVGWTMTDASLCGLGQTAASAVLSAMKLGLVKIGDGSGCGNGW